MKSLLVMFAVGILWSCAPVGDGNESAAKFTGGNETGLIPSPPSGKHYIGVTKLASEMTHPGGVQTIRTIEGSEVDIYLEVDFGAGDPVVNVKNSGDPHECDQIPSNVLKFYKMGFEISGDRMWQGKWTNNKGQRFRVEISQDAEAPSLIKLVFSVGYDMRTSKGVVKDARYVVRADIYSETDTAVDDDRHLPLKDVKKMFGSGDNCGESDSGENDTSNP